MVCGWGRVICLYSCPFWCLRRQSSLGSNSSSSKGCHVGKIKFVDYGEDYKVKRVSFGEDLKVRYVDYLAVSSGQWQVVDYGEDYKLKIVNLEKILQ